MSWLKNLFVSKETKILREKAKDFFEKILLCPRMLRRSRNLL